MGLSIEYLLKVVKAEPGNVLAIRALAEQYYLQGNFDKAAWYLNLSLEHEPGNPHTYRQLGLCFRRARRFNEAYRYLILALEAGGDKTDLWGLIGAVCRQMGRTKEARQYLKRAYDTGNHGANLLMCLAAERHIDGRIEEAIAFAKAAVVDTPGNVFFKFAVEALSVRQNNIESLPEAENQRRIALHINRPFHYSIMKPIFEALSKSYHVIMTGDPIWVRDFNPDYIFVSDAQSVQLKEIVPQAKYVFTRHGLISKNFAYRAVGGCDYICLSSQYLAQKYQQEGGFRPEQLWTVGYSQMDILFKPEPLEIKESLDKSQKTVLYAPTYNDKISSVPMLGPKIVEKIRGTASRVNLIIKPHPIICTHSRDWMSWFKDAAGRHENVFLVEDEGSDIMPYLKNADLLISDASSVMFQYLAMDRPIVLITNPERTQSSYYDDDGIEWKWRDMAEEITDISLLSAAVEEGLKHPDVRKSQREIYTERLFGDLRKGETGENIKITLDAMYGAVTPQA